MKKTFLTTLWDFYGPTYPIIVAQQLRARWYAIGDYIAWFWSTKHFSRSKSKLDVRQKFIVALYGTGFLLIVLLAASAFRAGHWQIGAALAVSYPIVLTHLIVVPLALAHFVWLLAHPKKLLRNVICSLIEHHVVRLRKKHSFVVVAVAGSVGKTSTKTAVARLLDLSETKVLVQEGNYNDRVTVPLVFFGLALPSLFNPVSWFKIIQTMRAAVAAESFPYDVVVLELGTDGPGQMRQFAYVRPEIAIVTSIAPEHMEFFKTLDEVAREELEILTYSGTTLVNTDDTDPLYLVEREYVGYGTNPAAMYRLMKRTNETVHGQIVRLELDGIKVKSEIAYLGKQGATIALAAAACASALEMPFALIQQNLPQLTAFAGRMQVLPGIRNSTLIDDTYNSSPLAVKAALDVLYATKSAQRIAILGDMNELGDTSDAAHAEIGEYCDPKKLDCIITIGAQSKIHLAPQAERLGCVVKSFDDPYTAGSYAQSILKDHALVLAKGSQNRVFAEEALKVLLKNPADEQKLVRQSKTWLTKKQSQFQKR